MALLGYLKDGLRVFCVWAREYNIAGLLHPLTYAVILFVSFSF